MSESPNPGLPRRDFLKLAWGGMGALALGGTGLVGLQFLASRVAGGVFGEELTAGLVENFPPGTVTPFNEGRFFLARLADGGFLALYLKCTHLDCVVLWDDASGQFHCPCHGSAFSPEGAVLNSPAPRPLAHFPVRFEDGKVLVHTGVLIQRDSVSPDEIVYPPEVATP